MNRKLYWAHLEEKCIVGPALLQETMNRKLYGAHLEENFIVGPALLQETINRKLYGTLLEEKFYCWSSTVTGGGELQTLSGTSGR
jgi:hypothetical protein